MRISPIISASRLGQLTKRYIVPGLIFQSVIVGGGYGTGREIVEFFLTHGPIAGLCGMLVSCLVWGIVMAVAFEFARKTRSYNYRSFFQNLLGPLWPLFEIIYLLIALLILAVLGSAAAEIFSNTFGIAGFYGSLILMIVVGLLAFLGGKVIEKFLTFWSVLLYFIYLVLMIWVINLSEEHIVSSFQQSMGSSLWFVDGVRYAAYNLCALAAVLFVVPHFDKPAQALGAGMIAGVLATLPGLMVFITLLAAYPTIIDAPVPILAILATLNTAWFVVVFQVMLFGTFIETGIGIIHAVNERIASTLKEKNRPFPSWARASMAFASLCFAIFLAERFGIISLIADGYGMLSYAYIAIVIIPLMTIGVVTIFRKN